MGKRTTYGVVVRGCSGRETMWVRSRPTADRIRRVLRAYKGFTGAATITALVELAARRPGIRVPAVLAEFEEQRRRATAAEA
jgi:hypothetical protein